MLASRKGQIGKKIEVVTVVIILVVILFNLFSALVPEAQSAGDSLNASNYCVSQGCFYNQSLVAEIPTSDPCRQENSSNTSNTCTVTHTVPLASVFSSNGVVILLLMFALLVGILKIVMPKSSKK